MIDTSTLKIGISFSGGGARGIAHIGVIKALEEVGIIPDSYSGVSMGAIVAGLAATDRSADEIFEIVGETRLYKLLTIGIPLSGLTDLSYLRNRLQKLVPHNSFEGLAKKLYIGATNLNTGQLEIFEQGELHKIVEASASVPLIFRPIEINGVTYVDGGLTNNLPIQPLKAHCDFVIGANCNPQVTVDTKNWNLKNVAERSLDIIMYQNAVKNKYLCDFFFQLDQTVHHNFLGFADANKIYRLGYEEAKLQIPQLIETINTSLH